MAEINQVDVLVKVEAPAVVDNQQLMVYIPVANYASGIPGVVKPNNDDFIVEADGTLKLNPDGTYLSGKVDTTNEENKLYGTDSKGYQTTLDYSETNIALAVVKRDNKGAIHITTTSDADSAVNVKYFTEALSTKLDAVTSTSKYSRLYAIASNGEQFVRNVSEAAEASTIPIRNEQGRLVANNAVESNELVPLNQFEQGLTDLNQNILNEFGGATVDEIKAASAAAIAAAKSVEDTKDKLDNLPLLRGDSTGSIEQQPSTYNGVPKNFSYTLKDGTGVTPKVGDIVPGSKSTGAFSFTAGLLNENAANYAFTFGYKNTVDYPAIESLVGGYNNHVRASASIVNGTNNYAEGSVCIVAGSDNNAHATGLIMAGDHNLGYSNGYSSIIAGSNNKVYAARCIVNGNNNQNIAQSGLMIGNGLKSGAVTAQVNLGTYNNARGDCALVIGCGTADNARANLVEQRLDGRLKLLKSKAVDDNDVVTLKEARPETITDVGDPVVTYDTTDGMTISATEQWIDKANNIYNVTTERKIPILAGDNVIISTTTNGKAIKISSTGGSADLTAVNDTIASTSSFISLLGIANTVIAHGEKALRVDYGKIPASLIPPPEDIAQGNAFYIFKCIAKPSTWGESTSAGVIEVTYENISTPVTGIRPIGYLRKGYNGNVNTWWWSGWTNYASLGKSNTFDESNTFKKSITVEDTVYSAINRTLWSKSNDTGVIKRNSIQLVPKNEDDGTEYSQLQFEDIDLVAGTKKVTVLQHGMIKQLTFTNVTNFTDGTLATSYPLTFPQKAGTIALLGDVGEAVTPSGATPTATNGTFTTAEWTKLQANKNNYILFNNEIYRLADTGHTGTTDIWSYVHTGWDGTATMDKSINVTIATGSWVLVTGTSAGGGKLYMHTLLLSKTYSSSDTARVIVISSKPTAYKLSDLDNTHLLQAFSITITNLDGNNEIRYGWYGYIGYFNRKNQLKFQCPTIMINEDGTSTTSGPFIYQFQSMSDTVTEL